MIGLFWFSGTRIAGFAKRTVWGATIVQFLFNIFSVGFLRVPKGMILEGH